jgi:hypothetical protein
MWTIGSIVLPGLLGGTLALGSLNSIAENMDIRTNAQNQQNIMSNKLIIAQQAALSQDAQAGALIKAGTDANKAAAAAIDAATKGIPDGKYKDATDVQAHIDKLNEGMKDVAAKIQGVKTAVRTKSPRCGQRSS